MKIALILTCCFLPTLGWGQQTNPSNPWKAAPLEVPEAVAKARVQARTILEGAGGAGGNLIVEVIDPPVLAKAIPVTAEPRVPMSEEELAARAARRAAEPNELLLFSPTVVIYEDGISLVRWGSVDRLKGYQQYAAFVRLDLSAIYACPDLTVGRRRYCMMPMMFYATDRMVQQWKAPSASSFKEPTDIVLVEGNQDNKIALEPLLALLEKFDTDGVSLQATAGAIKADQEARAAWEEAHPPQPEDVVIKFWPIESTQYSTTPVK